MSLGGPGAMCARRAHRNAQGHNISISCLERLFYVVYKCAQSGRQGRAEHDEGRLGEVAC